MQYDPIQLVRVIVYSEGQAINGISFTYVDKHGQHHEEGPWGGADEDETPHRDIELSHADLKEISGTCGKVGNMNNIITSLRFVTNKGKTYTFGNSTGTPFHVPMQEGKIIGFFGRAGDYLDALGIYCAA